VLPSATGGYETASGISNPDDAAEGGNSASQSDDGDGVASSLAAGLRLSPASEANASSDQVMASDAHAQPEDGAQPDEGPSEPPDYVSPQGCVLVSPRTMLNA
jgi:hypothetical protein